MHGIPVELINEGIDWPAWVQAVGSVVAIPVSVWGAYQVQEHGRQRDLANKRANRIIALTAIAERCKRTIGHLHERAQKGSFKVDELGWLADEAAALEARLDAIDLMEIDRGDAIKLVVELQHAARTARRRLGYIGKGIRSKVQPGPKEFEGPYTRAASALAALEGMALMGGGAAPATAPANCAPPPPP